MLDLEMFVISLEGLMLKLKLQYFGHLRQRADSLEKILMLGKTKSRHFFADKGLSSQSSGFSSSHV